MKGQPSEAAAPRNVANAVVVKSGDVFLLSDANGEVPPGNRDGFGLYYHDCRYLNGYVLDLQGTRTNPLFASAADGTCARFELTNEKLLRPGGVIDERTFGISLERTIDGGRLALRDVWTVVNFDVEAHEITLGFGLDSGFEDIFAIRGLHPQRIGHARTPAWSDGALVLGYDGADGLVRRLEARFDPPPSQEHERGGEFRLKLRGGERRTIEVTLRITETPAPGAPRASAAAAPGRVRPGSSSRSSAKRAEFHCDNLLVDHVAERSLLDLETLTSELDGFEYFAAGLPWFGTLFGRDSIIAALQVLAFEPRMAEQTLRLLALHQGTKTDDWRDEEPGKILHELRRGELARLNEVPQTPYYGSVDATPLFLVLLGEHAQWTGSLALFEELKPHVERALEWIARSSDPQTGYLRYASRSSRGLDNHGWKDSGVAVMNADGSLATPPIALVEVQGYVYRAKLLMAGLYARARDPDAARRLRTEAEDLRERFERDFWMPGRGFYALALHDGGRRAEVVSSNPGQALWSGIVEPERARAIVSTLMSPDLFSGWGIRTLSRKERRYNPIGYHIGSVWPHDNGLIAAGFRRYGFDDEALRVFDTLLHAAAGFAHHRLPEVFAGFERGPSPIPVRYPTACHPQAWAAGSVPFMLTSLLGLTADAFHQRLRVLRPVLPIGVDELELRRVSVGGGSADLLFRRARGGGIEVEPRNESGGLHVEIEGAARHVSAA